jgi:hypothetical protein
MFGIVYFGQTGFGQLPQYQVLTAQSITGKSNVANYTLRPITGKASVQFKRSATTTGKAQILNYLHPGLAIYIMQDPQAIYLDN